MPSASAASTLTLCADAQVPSVKPPAVLPESAEAAPGRSAIDVGMPPSVSERTLFVPAATVNGILCAAESTVLLASSAVSVIV